MMLYGFSNRMYRNDYALSIALQALNGFSTTNHTSIPGKLYTAGLDVSVLKAPINGITVLSTSQGLRIIKDESIHFMNKEDLIKSKSFQAPLFLLSSLSEQFPFQVCEVQVLYFDFTNKANTQGSRYSIKEIDGIQLIKRKRRYITKVEDAIGILIPGLKFTHEIFVDGCF